MTSGSISFQETGPVYVGTTIHADCVWQDAVWNVEDMGYAGMWLIHPDNVNCDSYWAHQTGEENGTKVLQCKTTQVGQYKAQLWVWDGTKYLVYEAYIQVQDGNGVACKDHKMQSECIDANCFWYAKYFWEEPSCHDVEQDMMMTYLPFILMGAGGAIIIAALVSKPKG